MTGAAVQWLRDGLQIVGSAAETAAVAATVEDTDGVVFVPALTGLGAPTGTRTPAARSSASPAAPPAPTSSAPRWRRSRSRSATCWRRCPADGDTPLRVDGGASANDLLCQLQADQVGRVVQRPRIVETTGLGAAFLAGPGRRGLGLHRRPPRDLAARPVLRAGHRPHEGRRRPRPVAKSRGKIQDWA